MTATVFYKCELCGRVIDIHRSPDLSYDWFLEVEPGSPLAGDHDCREKATNGAHS